MNIQISNFKFQISKYNPLEIEPKWQEVWQKSGIYSPDFDGANKPFLDRRSQNFRGKFYNLMMFPYPSAEGMHVGNMYAFTGADVYGRFKRMQGYDVFEPIGLDGFGIHSENYAIKVGRHPKEQAKISEKNFYRQLHATGNSYDWSRTVETYDPDYYKWTQWIFIQLFKKGLAYRKKSPVNFCPSCKTVLSDEQVIDGKCERCSSIVEKRELEQWFFKITKYADRLLNGLTQIDWTEKVKIAQRQWIGRSEGALIEFKVQNSKFKIEVFTVFPETIYGVTYMVLAPEHPFVKDITSSLARSHPFGLSAQSRRLARLKDYVERSKKKTEQERIAEGKEKTGVFTGFYCINPVNNQKVPIWVADYVIATYGTGAVMGVPGSDHRDFAFARKYKLPIIRVIGKAKDDLSEVDSEEKVLEEGILVNSQQFSGMPTPNPARDKIKDFLEERGFGKRKNQYHLRDWLISRQRYWGPPIPMIYCEKCASEKKGYFEVGSEKRDAESLNSRNQDIKESKSRIPHFSHQESPMYGWFPVPEENLPVLLPDVKDWRPKGTGKSPLASLESFVNTKCPNCGGNAVRETDVSDTFLDSSWYFLRYLATDRNDIPFPSLKFQLSVLGSQLSETGSSVVGQSVTERQKTDKLESENRQQKTDNRIKWLPVNMYIGGAEHSVLHLLYVRFLTMVFHDLGLIDFDEPFPRFYAHGLLIKEGGKMSKSKGNVVVPDEYIKKYGADTLRTYLMFLGPFSQGGDFYDNSISGVYRFLGRVYKLVSGFVEKEHLQSQARSAKENVEPAGSQIAKKVHQTIKKVTNDMEALRFNTAIAAQMELLNTFYLYQKALKRTDLEQMLLMLAPFAPHITEELWQRLRFSVFSSRLSVPSQSVISQSVTEKQKTGKQKSENRQQKTDNWSIHLEPWPTYDPKLLEEEEVTVVVQINGKVRDNFKFQISNFKFQNKVEEEALKREKVKKHLDGKKIKRVVYVAGKIINFVVG